jgi:hypothetical protein
MQCRSDTEEAGRSHVVARSKSQPSSEKTCTVHMLIMHIVTMHKSYNASTFQDPDVVPK